MAKPLGTLEVVLTRFKNRKNLVVRIYMVSRVNF
jgi:hypothetical protein